jgi:inner membrane protein
MFLGPVLASMAPDLDIVMQFKGDLAYIRNHRGLSHSIPALLIWSGVITILLHLALPATVPITTLFLVTAAGAVSHSLFDMFNSYGVRLLWPFVKRKIAFNVVSLVDWLIVTLSIFSMIVGSYYPAAFSVWAAIMFAYLLYRKWIACSLRMFLRANYAEQEIQNVIILPARYQIFSWDFLVETKGLFMIGKIHSFSHGTKVCSRMEKTNKSNPFIQAALNSPLGKLFSEFTPHFHVMYQQKDCRHMVQFTDLRYYHNHDFMHTGSIFLDEQCCAIEQVFQPYNRRHRVIIG